MAVERAEELKVGDLDAPWCNATRLLVFTNGWNEEYMDRMELMGTDIPYLPVLKMGYCFSVLKSACSLGERTVFFGL
jgi:hypothetical protein